MLELCRWAPWPCVSRTLVLRSPCTSVLRSQFHSVVIGNKRRVNAGVGIVVDRDLLLRVPGLAPIRLVSQWAPGSLVLISQCPSAVVGNKRRPHLGGRIMCVVALQSGSSASRCVGCFTCGRRARTY